MTNTCHDCHTAIPTGHAHLRSKGFERTDRYALCRGCMDLRRATDAAVRGERVTVAS